MDEVVANDSNQTTETKVEEKPGEGLKDILAAFSGSPSDEKIEGWKNDHGEVMCSGFSASEVFIFRPLTRQEYVQVQLTLSQAQSVEDQFGVEQQIVETCLLWASEPGLKSLQSKGGSLSTLHEQVMQNSNFVNPAMAAALVIKL